MKPLELACNTASPKLVGQAVGIIQKIIMHECVGDDSIDLLVSLLTNVEKISDEGVQLKILQTSLILMQSPIHPRTSDSISSLLSLCFRAILPKGKKSQVTSTAAATVRQAVAIVFSYVDVPTELSRIGREGDNGQRGSSMFHADNNLSDQKDPQTEAIIASQNLLEDLIALSSGSPATWIKTPSVPRTFSLEILDFALLSSSSLFMALPGFESSLSLRVIQLLQSQFQDHLDAASSGASQAAQNYPAFKATLRCIRTVLLQYHAKLGNRCRNIIQILLKGAQLTQSNVHKIAIVQIMRQLLGSPALVNFLFVTFDMHKEKQTELLCPIVEVLASSADSGIEGSLQDVSSGDQITKADAMAQLYFSREMNFDSDVNMSIPVSIQNTALGVVSMGAILQCMNSISQIIFQSLGMEQEKEDSPKAVSPRFHYPSLPIENMSIHNCESLVNATWEPLLSVVLHIFKLCSTDKMERVLLSALEEFTAAIGKLHLREPVDAYLHSLCDVAIGDMQGISKGEYEDGDGELVLRSKNVQAMKTVFNIAKELANDLGPAWRVILETMYSLDRILLDNKSMMKGQERKMKEIGSIESFEGDLSKEDVDELKHSIQLLFDGTREMSSEGVVALLGGLRDVSIRHLPTSARSSQPK